MKIELEEILDAMASIVKIIDKNFGNYVDQDMCFTLKEIINNKRDITIYANAQLTLIHDIQLMFKEYMEYRSDD